jgi:hypothetical protein
MRASCRHLDRAVRVGLRQPPQRRLSTSQAHLLAITKWASLDATKLGFAVGTKLPIDAAGVMVKAAPGERSFRGGRM